MIKAVIFDVGGVLIRTLDRSRRFAWEKKLGLGEWESEAIVFGGEMGTKAQLGEITDSELWQWIGKRLSLDEKALTTFQRDFWAGDYLDKDLVEYIRSLRPKFQTAIISNATDALRQNLSTVYPMADAFELIVCSAEEGVMKPNEAIYKSTLARLGRDPKETVLIDDSRPNVIAARQLGMQAIHFKPDMKLQTELTNIIYKQEV